MNLLTAPWLPWLLADGSRTTGPLSRLFAGLGTPQQVVDLDIRRPDERMAMLEFLIGVVSVVLNVQEDRMRELLDDPPSPDEFDAERTPLLPAFEVDGNGPRFLQDLNAADFDDAEVLSPAALWIDSPGDKTVSLNTDLFVHERDNVAMSLAEAVIAQITLQAFAPSGGQGHRTSLRGGGPLVTLVEPRSAADADVSSPRRSLWFKVWANLLTLEQMKALAPGQDVDGVDYQNLSRMFPWMAATRTSDSRTGAPTNPSDGHPVQSLFSMPRRLRLEFESTPILCPITGRMDPVRVIGVRRLNYGVQYVNWSHPFSPQYQLKDSWLFVHAQPTGAAWRDWPEWGLTGKAPEGRKTALAVRHFQDTRGKEIGAGRIRVHVGGADFDNMKLRGWVEAEMPSFVLPPDRTEFVSMTATSARDAADVCARTLQWSCKIALYERPKDVGGLEWVRARFWEATEPAFLQLLEQASTASGGGTGASGSLGQGIETSDGAAAADAAATASLIARQNLLKWFLEQLKIHALRLFNEICPLSAVTVTDYARVLSGLRHLQNVLNGFQQDGKTLFSALGLPLPQTVKAPATNAPKPARAPGTTARGKKARAGATAPEGGTR